MSTNSNLISSIQHQGKTYDFSYAVQKNEQEYSYSICALIPAGFLTLICLSLFSVIDHRWFGLVLSGSIAFGIMLGLGYAFIKNRKIKWINEQIDKGITLIQIYQWCNYSYRGHQRGTILIGICNINELNENYLRQNLSEDETLCNQCRTEIRDRPLLRA